MSNKTMIDSKYIERLASIMVDNNLNKISIETEQASLKMQRGLDKTIVTSSALPAVSHVPVQEASLVTSVPNSSSSETQKKDDILGKKVNSPMVGTVYLSPTPGAKPFVQIGDIVEKDQQLLIVEAMKVMNIINAPVAGKITHILVKDAEPVEYDEPLIVIEP